MFYADPSLLTEGVSSYRRSSWDRTGRNNDFLNLLAGQTVTLLEETGPGKICHFYWATVFASRFHYRQLVLRAYWDGEMQPSIEAPLGDLFCIPHCTPVPIHSLAAVINPGSPGLLTLGANLYLPMPFAESARITLTYEPIPDHLADSILFWYHINLERHSQPPAGNVGRFHAQWRRENLTQTSDPAFRNVQLWDGVNLDGRQNYVALQAEGRGQMVGLHLQVDNVGGGWYGEGDDMVFVDGQPGELWPPTYHGTGSEEIFGGGACPDKPYAGLYTGFHMVESPDFSGKHAMYRWYLTDPIRFERSLVWSVEHGHANSFENDYTSVAYWYQQEPHAAFPALQDVTARLPRFSDLVWRADAARGRAKQELDRLLMQGLPPEDLGRILANGAAARDALVEGRLEEAIALFKGAKG